MYTCTRRDVAEAVMRQEQYERTLAKLQALAPPVLTREQILAALARADVEAVRARQYRAILTTREETTELRLY